MRDYQPIIDVTPLEHSSKNGAGYGTAPRTSEHASSQSSSYRQPTWRSSTTARTSTTNTAGTQTRTTHTYGAPFPPFGTTFSYETTDTATVSKASGSVVAGLVQIAVGAGLVLIGVPMLILPGPGLLSIVGGIALTANGMRKIFGL